MLNWPVISVAHYQLIPQGTVGVRGQTIGRGALLKFQWNSDQIGYADCFPWPELGDATLDEQLASLKKREVTSLLERSITFAKVDAEARAAGKSVWCDVHGKSMEIPKSHALVLNSERLSTIELRRIVQRGFQFLKLKMGSDLYHEAHHIRSCIPFFLEHGLRIRLDFNARTSFNQLSAFLNALGSHLEWIDFIEDPCPFEARTWTFIQKQWNVRLALDCIPFGFKFEALLDRSAVSVFIIKPAIQDTNRLFQVADRLQMPIVVTSYLDHPLGQVCAAWIAAQRRRIGPHHLLETCGLVSHMAYDSHPFSEQLGAWTPQLKLPLGTGFGFDKLLKEQKWERV